ncbi:MAG: SagB/ThcOx family dehydrogenase [Promethearchaeota archaeon]
MSYKDGRKFLRFYNRENYETEIPESDQTKKLAKPLAELDYDKNTPLIDLVSPENIKIGSKSFSEILNSRQSRRKFTEHPLTLEQLSFLLWATQGVRKEVKFGIFRTVPSAGARSPFETYLYINHVEGLNSGIYRYISLQHKLLFIKDVPNGMELFSDLAYNQKFVGNSAVIFFWIAVPYRTEWRYTSLAHKFIAIDVGIVCENLYLACEAANLGTVTVGYYEQEKLDEVLGFDGEEAFTILLAPVGNVKRRMALDEFLLHQKEPVDITKLQHYLGSYYIPNGPQLKLIVRNNQFVLSDDHLEETLTPHNATEFIGGDLIRAVRFVLNTENQMEKAIVLVGAISDKDIMEFQFKS